ncbi:5'/3'-nucleotidase SurE [Nitratifractor salsuginis]|uniref:5'-nucleotidase SurE n=1 Tax=Nitratifractor salsuginis (strain DSM 16511 / JCM 12458 / E9I37-1) TaxID=749222 RepID=E6X3J6_NITSE|nr:5'/3'-nucleotidase SurE [Nitratifractor salsuginis]ADV46273.1 5'-nucleotidase; exopolyphosphatase; 3'-nucleotidase [Nitratifractor salsuginis DSM 16511]
MAKTPRILVTNDDGFESPGLHALREALSEVGEVITVAPTLEKSACGHSLTLTRPLRFVELEHNFYKLDDGTPSDCVFLSLKKLFEEAKPDLVVSGINRGANMGEDITYSGTAAAAMEAVLQGIPAIAISQVCRSQCQEIDELGYRLARETARTLAKKVLSEGFPLPERQFLNVNIPPVEPEECRGWQITHAGRRAYGNDAQVHINPRGQEYYWIGLPRLDWHPHPHPRNEWSDFEAVRENYVSITPIQLDMTSYGEIERLKGWMNDGNRH